jgi:hypothetical protein
MHQKKFVSDFFIRSFPQYAFRHFYIAIIRGIVKFVHRPMFLGYIRTVKSIFVITTLYKLYKIV